MIVHMQFPPWRDSAKSQLLRLIHQNTKKSTKVLYIHSILEELSKALLKMFLTDADRLALPRRPEDVILEHIF